MRKLLAISLLALLMLGMNAFATETRTLTIGDNNNVVLDDANIWLYPSRINDYPSLAIGEFQNFTGDNFGQFGIHWKFNSANPWVLGTYFDNMDSFEPEDLVFGDDLVSWDFDELENRRIHLFYGRKLSDMYFGTRFTVINSSSTLENELPAEDNSTESISYYDLSLGLTDGAGAWDLALGAAIGTWTDEDAAGETETEPDGFMDLSLMGRYFKQMNPSYTLVPHAGFLYSKRGAKYGDDESFSTNAFALQVGAGLNYTPATNVFAVADFGLTMYKASGEYEETGEDLEEYDYSELWLPYFRIGLDADVFRWMDVRLGATSTWTRTKDETVIGDVVNQAFKTNYADNETYLGFGFHWNRLHIDTYTDPQMFLDGLNFISGEENEMNFRISAVYEMM